MTLAHLSEAVTAAAQSAELTLSAVKQAHSAACSEDGNGALQMLLFDAISAARTLSDRLEMIRQCADAAP